MKKRYKVTYREDFARKVENITAYILYELQNPIASYRFQVKLLQTLSILPYFPEGMPVYQNTNYHYLIMKHWLIFYKIQDNTVILSRILSSKQNLNNKFLSD